MEAFCSRKNNNAMFTSFNIQSPYAAAQPSCGQVAFFVSCERSWQSCFNGNNPRGRRNLAAMRDQHFQDLMSKFDNNLLNDGPGNVSETSSSYYSVGEAKPSISEELDSQLSFKQFLKRSLPNRKPSSEFIKSIKDRIKIIETPDSSI